MFKTLLSQHFKNAQLSFFSQQPFPYLIIDDFLPKETYNKTINELKEINIDPDLNLNDSTTKNKQTFSVDNKIANVGKIVKVLSSKEMLTELENMTGLENILPLSSFKVDQTGLRFLHQMQPDGFLGVHVDHIRMDDSIHFLNAILYLTEDSILGKGGNTCFYDKTGYKKIAEVRPKPNRLVIFFHSSESFHSVSTLDKDAPFRHTLYMDYYVVKDELKKLYSNKQVQFLPKFWDHRTTFIPIKPSDFWTLKTYVKYRLKKFYKRIV